MTSCEVSSTDIIIFYFYRCKNRLGGGYETCLIRITVLVSRNQGPYQFWPSIHSWPSRAPSCPCPFPHTVYDPNSNKEAVCIIGNLSFCEPSPLFIEHVLSSLNLKYTPLFFFHLKSFKCRRTRSIGLAFQQFQVICVGGIVEIMAAFQQFGVTRSHILILRVSRSPTRH